MNGTGCGCGRFFAGMAAGLAAGTAIGMTMAPSRREIKRAAHRAAKSVSGPAPPGLPALWAPGFEPKWGTSPLFPASEGAFHRFFQKSKAFCPPMQSFCNHFFISM